ncbi:phosphatase PAP2 family protein [Flagellimonas crocea]|uniref:phosphatase PAP2 family protein n=1 Tax=Flagellimonas crocea TaxID=3067311 RepID=UPI00296F379D|nr:phosphatase PAP2 family protein [Muricauda sp. DH64]
MVKESLQVVVRKVEKCLYPLLEKYRHKGAYVATALAALILVILAINIFVELTETLTTEMLGTYDQSITQYVLSFRSPRLTNFFLFMTNVGDLEGYLTILGIMVPLTAIVFKKWKYVGQICLVLFLASTSNLVLKRFINRARPELEHMVSVETLSYPSGHAMSAMAFYGFLIYLVYTFRLNKYLKSSLILLLILLILSIGISRIYLGVHFPSDIAGGFIAGGIWVFLCVLLFNLVEVFRKDSETR